MNRFRLARYLLGITIMGLGLVLRSGVTQGADPVVVEPGDLARRADLVGREVTVDDRIRYFMESKRGQGFDALLLKRTDVPFHLPARLRSNRPPTEPNAVVRGILKTSNGHLFVDVGSLELLPADRDRLEQELGRILPDDFASKRAWGLWAQRRGAELADPSLIAKGTDLEADALWSEASRAGADSIALADRSRDRPIPESTRNALYHRGFRALEAKAESAQTLDELANRVKIALPRSTPPSPGSGTARPTEEDPGEAYRKASPENQSRMDRGLYADLLEKSLRRRLTNDPTRANALADEAAGSLPDRPEVAVQLRQRGLTEAERGVANLRQSELEELARTFRAQGQDDRAQHLLKSWLGDRRQNRLSANDADGRVLLAASYVKLLDDRATAGELLAEAAKIDPGSTAVTEAFLRLGFRKGDSGWHDPSVASRLPVSNPSQALPTGPQTEEENSLRGLTRLQARSRMGGKPDRVVRIATQGLIVEQWIYQIGRTRQYLLFRIDPGSPEPRVSASFSVAQ